jgi:hypothetical protein
MLPVCRSLDGSQIEFCRTEWLVGSEISLTTFGFAQKVGDGAIGLTLTSMDLGEIEVTTTESPDGTGAYYKPRFLKSRTYPIPENLLII